jgi:hypothetical protein
MGNIKGENNPEIIQSLLKNYQKFGCGVSLEIPFFHTHLSFIPEQPDAVSVE